MVFRSLQADLLIEFLLVAHVTDGHYIFQINQEILEKSCSFVLHEYREGGREGERVAGEERVTHGSGVEVAA